MSPRTLLLLLAFAAVPATAEAQEAGALYKKGMAAMAAGKLAQACPLLERSYEKDARLPTLFAVAQCQAKQNRMSLALEHYKAYVERVGLASPAEQQTEADRKKIADQQIEALEKTLPELTFVLPANAPDGTIVKLDGHVAPFLSNVRVQPGDHIVILEVPDIGKVETKVSVAAGEKKQVPLTLPGKTGEPVAAAVAPPPAPPPPSPPPPAVKSEEPAPSLQKQEPPRKPVNHTAAWIVGGVGVAGIAAGSVFGLMALGKSKTVEEHCLDVICDAEGKKAGDQGKTLGWISTGAFAIGAVGVGVSLYLLFSDPAPSKAAVTKAPAWQPIVAGAQHGTGGFVGVRSSF